MKLIYLCDDDQDDQEQFGSIVSQIIKESVLTIYNNGQDLLLKLYDSAEVLPDIIFMDINMPFINGIKSLQEIKSHTHLHNPIVIYITSFNVSDINATYSLGAQNYFIKPASLADLKLKLQKLLVPGLTGPVEFLV